MGVLSKEELLAGGSKEAGNEWGNDHFGGDLLSTALGDATGDVTTLFNAALTKMNATQRPLIIDKSITISGGITLNGYCVIRCTEDSWINIVSGNAGIRAENTYIDVGAWTALPSLVTSPDSTGSVVTAFTVDAATFSALSVGDSVYVKDSVENTFSYNGTNNCGLAEICSVIEKRGTDLIVLSRVIGDQSLYPAIS